MSPTQLIDHIGLIVSPVEGPAPGDMVIRGDSGGWTTMGLGDESSLLQVRSGIPEWTRDPLTAFIPSAPWLMPCAVVAKTNVALTGLQTIDGHTLNPNERVLAIAQTSGVQNGAWVAHVGGWTRPADYDSDTELLGGRQVQISQGDSAGEAYVLAQQDVTVDTDATTWALDLPKNVPFIDKAQAWSQPQIFRNSDALHFTVGGTPKIPVPIGTDSMQVDNFGNFRYGPGYNVEDWNPGTTHTFVPEVAVLANTPGRVFLHDVSAGEFNDPADLTFTRWGPFGGYGGGVAAVLNDTATNTVTVVSDTDDALVAFVIGQKVYGDNVQAIIPPNTVIDNAVFTPNSGTGVSGFVTLTLSNAISAIAGGTIFSVAREQDLTAAGSGAIVGQVKMAPAVAPYLGDQTTPGATKQKQNVSIDLVLTETPRFVTPAGDIAQAGEVRFSTTKKGRGTADLIAKISDGGKLLIGAGAIGAGDNGDFLQIRGNAGVNEQHQLTVNSATIGTLASALNPGGGNISSLPLGGSGSSALMVNGTTVTTTFTVGTEIVATQTWTLRAQLNVGDPSVLVVAQTPNYAYPSGQAVKGTAIAASSTGFKLSFYQDPPANGYPPIIGPTANIGSVVAGAGWQATITQIRAALAALDAGSQTLTCSIPFSAGPFVLITITKPNGTIPKRGATVTDPQPPNSNPPIINAGATVASTADGAPADPSPTSFYISGSTTNNSNGKLVIISDCGMGLIEGVGMNVTGGPLPQQQVTIEFIGAYGHHKWYPMAVDNSGLTGGTIKCAELQIGIPDDGDFRSFFMRRMVVPRNDYGMIQDETGAVKLQMDKTGLLTVTNGIATKNVNTTGLTSAQIDALYTFGTPSDGTIMTDPTQKLILMRQGGKWYKNSAMTLIA